MQTLNELMSLEGKVALVTGGAGHIGRAINETIAELGGVPVIVDIDQSRVDEEAVRLKDQYGVEAGGFVCDLADEQATRKLPQDVVAECGGLDILVNNAAFVGTSDLTGFCVPFEQQTVETWRKVLEVNVTAAFNITQAATPFLKKNGRGRILNISSLYGIAGPDLRLYEGTKMGNAAAYAVSKGGLIQMTRWLSTVLAPEVRVNAISPGGIERGQDAGFIERYVSRTPMGRMGREEDLKGAVAYLVSDLSAYVTGHNIPVDGGWTVW